MFLVEWALGSLNCCSPDILTRQDFFTPASEAGAASSGSLTLEAFSNNILRVRVVPLSKARTRQRTRYRSEENSVKLLEQPKNPDGSRTVTWGTHKIQVQEGPLRLTITDTAGKVWQGDSFRLAWRFCALPAW